MAKKVLSMITCGAENNTIDIIKNNFDTFNKIIIVEGGSNFDPYFDLFGDLYYDINMIDHSKVKFIERFNEPSICIIKHKLYLVKRPWNDNYAEAYMAHLNLLNEGDWVLIVDSDEYPSLLLKQNLDKIIQESDNGNNFDIVMLPVVDFLDQDPLWKESDVPQQYVQGMWAKSILLRKGTNPIQLRSFGSHVIPLGTKATYYPYPYEHHKIWQSFCDNEIYQMLLCPEGQGVSQLDAAIFKTALDRSNIKTMKELKDRIQNGQLPYDLQSLAIKNRDKKKADGHYHPFAQMYIAYFLIYGPQNRIIPPDNSITLEEVKEYIYNLKIHNHTYRNHGCSCKICQKNT